jgi:hypothetical protein
VAGADASFEVLQIALSGQVGVREVQGAEGFGGGQEGDDPSGGDTRGARKLEGVEEGAAAQEVPEGHVGDEGGGVEGQVSQPGAAVGH